MLILLDFSVWPDFIRFLGGLYVSLVVRMRARVLLVRAGLAAISQRARWAQRAMCSQPAWAVGSGPSMGVASWAGQPAGSGPAVVAAGQPSSIEWVPWAGGSRHASDAPPRVGVHVPPATLKKISLGY